VSTPVQKQAGVRYAVGLLFVTAAAAPNVACGLQPAAASARAPRTAASLTGQTDLPAGTITAGSLVNLSSPPYAVCL
jgi:hypothetical protein